ncbi:MAG: pseudouridine synthase, partial [Pseudomonadales bacterium]
VHGGSGVSLGVIEALRLLYPEQKSLELVHRLDRETSGCLLISKKRATLRHLHAELHAGWVDKTYLTLVHGHWPRHLQQVDAPLRKNELVSGERMVKVDEQGKAARTMFRVRQRYVDCTLLEVKPVTGRTHQIRVHARHMGHPVAGDSKYGSREFNQQLRNLGLKRLFLHAQSLRFTLPGSAQPVNVEAGLTADLEASLTKLAKGI